AAGGLAMIACGLVPELTGQAAKLAVLGAGAKVLRVYGYNLNRDDVKEIESIRPDILLLAGGTDGGNKRFLLENAQALAENVSPLPVVLAGNRNAVYEA
ncbi:MAG TPA: MutL protein, partial [Firmicutes bacterium]|nr:MutL protein [Bacillota bacterium]